MSHFKMKSSVLTSVAIHVDGKVNKHNFRVSRAKHFQVLREKAGYSEKVAVCSVISVNQVFEPILFVSPIVIGASYKHLLIINFFPMLPNVPPDTNF